MKLKNFTFDKLSRIVRRKLNPEERIKEEDKQNIIDNFTLLFHQEDSSNFKWFGTEILKYPTDLMMYQEIINETKPDILIECGTHKGGSALYFAHLFDLIGNGEVITIDIKEYPTTPKHFRITYLIGSSVSEEISNKIKELCKGKRVMVILDSNHYKNHVLKELNIYGELVSKDCYLIVEDTNVNGHPIYKNFGAGAMEAVEEFMKDNNEFIIDRTKEKFLLTANPKGYLKRK